MKSLFLQISTTHMIMIHEYKLYDCELLLQIINNVIK